MTAEPPSTTLKAGTREGWNTHEPGEIGKIIHNRKESIIRSKWIYYWNTYQKHCMSCRGREDVTILEINSEARIEFFLVFVALMTWGVPAYYSIETIHLESKHVEILLPIFPTPGPPRETQERSTFWEISTSGNQETKSKPLWSRKHRLALASGGQVFHAKNLQSFGKFIWKLLPSQKLAKHSPWKLMLWSLNVVFFFLGPETTSKT